MPRRPSPRRRTTELTPRCFSCSSRTLRCVAYPHNGALHWHPSTHEPSLNAPTVCHGGLQQGCWPGHRPSAVLYSMPCKGVFSLHHVRHPAVACRIRICGCIERCASWRRTRLWHPPVTRARHGTFVLSWHISKPPTPLSAPTTHSSASPPRSDPVLYSARLILALSDTVGSVGHPQLHHGMPGHAHHCRSTRWPKHWGHGMLQNTALPETPVPRSSTHSMRSAQLRSFSCRSSYHQSIVMLAGNAARCAGGSGRTGRPPQRQREDAA